MLVLETSNTTALNSIATAVNNQDPSLKASVTDNGLHINKELKDQQILNGIGIAAFILRG